MLKKSNHLQQIARSRLVWFRQSACVPRQLQPIGSRARLVVAGEGKRHTFLLVSQRFSSASEQAMSQFGYGPKLRHWVLLGWSARCAGLHGTHDYVLNGVSVRRLILALWLNERSWKQTG